MTTTTKSARPTPSEIADKLLADVLEGEGHLPAWRAHQLIVQAIEDERRAQPKPMEQLPLFGST